MIKCRGKKMNIEIRGKDKNRIEVSFPYNQKVISALRTVPGRRWDPQGKIWTIPDKRENGEKLLKALYHTGLFNFNSKEPPLTPLSRMKRELKISDYSPKTIKVYSKQVGFFFERTGLNPEEVRREDVILYLESLQRTTGLSRSLAAQIITGLKHFYSLGMGWNGKGPADTIPFPKKSRKYPDILSSEEVNKLINSPENLKHRFLLNLIYSCGLRVGEAVTLKPSDLDFERMLIHVRQGKGKKDRFVMLSTRIVELYKVYKKDFILRSWLFPSRSPDDHLSIRSAQAVFEKAREKSGTTKDVSIHSLRHAFATHLLENGVDLRYIQELMGHASSRTTEIYTHVSRTEVRKITSPLDYLG